MFYDNFTYTHTHDGAKDNLNMKGSFSHDVKVKVPAAEAWKVYGTLRLSEVVRQRLPNVLSRLDVLEGDGGPGTKMHLVYPPGNPLGSLKEEFLVVDDQTMTKITQVYEGGYLNFGITLYRVTFRVVPDPEDDRGCTVKCTLDYEIREDSMANAGFVSIKALSYVMDAANDYLLSSSGVTN
ncbi:OLC1v1001525C1 [Oldenlandia corymbosa var. corymbosa]|uniref:OLC1v1001525C1 n=1 Tax=Oldenlandia corymbosa var. corymbosa TaxID=529605 RepID=A0AAV1D5D1_OLDCO|nr:OLC1v1001525C1 [Oldenlandia corymbosa var. corymbosa]